MLTKNEAKKILEIYGKAWETQDSDLILTIFTKNAVYHERAFEKPFAGHSGIRKYWQTKVVKEQSNIQFKLLDFWIDGDTLIAEWDVKFFEISKNEKKHIKEVAIMKIKNGKIVSDREYWHSKEI